MKKNNAFGLALILWTSLAWATSEEPPPPKKKLTLQDLLNSTTRQSSVPSTTVAVDTQVRDFPAIDRLDHVVVHEDELNTFLKEGKLKPVSGSTKLAKVTGGLSDTEEIQIGREVAANLAARYGLVEDEAKVRYVNRVGQAVVKHGERNKIPYHFGILRTAEINAMAAPVGYVFITQGLLDSLKDESELAGVLAHEVTHITRRHIVKAAQAAGQNVSSYAQLSDFSINLLSKGLSRADELEADKFGTLLAAKVGYDAYGLRRSIETLATKQKANLLLSGFNKTHPPAADRLKIIDRTIHNNHLSAKGQRLDARFVKTFSLSPTSRSTNFKSAHVATNE